MCFPVNFVKFSRTPLGDCFLFWKTARPYSSDKENKSKITLVENKLTKKELQKQLMNKYFAHIKKSVFNKKLKKSNQYGEYKRGLSEIEPGSFYFKLLTLDKV